MSARRRLDYCGLVCLSLIRVSSVARADGFAFFRYDDDFTYLSDPSKRVSWYDEIKYIPLGDDASHGNPYAVAKVRAIAGNGAGGVRLRNCLR